MVIISWTFTSNRCLYFCLFKPHGKAYLNFFFFLFGSLRFTMSITNEPELVNKRRIRLPSTSLIERRFGDLSSRQFFPFCLFQPPRSKRMPTSQSGRRKVSLMGGNAGCLYIRRRALAWLRSRRVAEFCHKLCRTNESKSKETVILSWLFTNKAFQTS